MSQSPHAGTAFQRARRVLLRAWSRQRRRHPRPPRLPRLVTGVVCILAGWMIVTSAITARGTDLRPSRNTDLISLVQSERSRNQELVERVSRSRTEVDALTAQRNKLPNVDVNLNTALQQAGMTEVVGPAVTVTLTDAPVDVDPEGVDGDLLVVHQQDIQAVVNALWAGGAEAMTIQGIRVVSTTAVKCVGNTVVLHGIPYAPPYVVSAIGDQARMQNSLASNSAIINYRQYADTFGLGYAMRTEATWTMAGHQGRVDLEYARQSDQQPSASASPTR